MSTPKERPRSPKDIRELDRDEMIEYLQKHDEEIPNDVDEWERASLKKRVILCMKQLNMNGTPADNGPNPVSQKIIQSAIPQIPRVSRKRKADYPSLTGTRNKRMRTNLNANVRLLPIATDATLIQEIPAQEQKDEDIDISLLKINFDFRDSKLCNDDVLTNKLLNAVKNGIPARYDIVPLPHSIFNFDHNTSYLRSSKMQKLFEICHIEQEIHCTVRTDDDEYQLSNHYIQQIEGYIGEWIHKNGEYSSNIHPSLHKNAENKLEAKDHIFQYEVLGRFIGDELAENEFHDIYSGTFTEYNRSMHSWVFEVDIPIIDKKSDCNDLKYEQYDMLVDCLGKNKQYSPLLLIEDCRSDLTKKCVTTKEDLKKENVLFVTIKINGWPGKFAIAKQNINKNELLYGHFGDGYFSLRKQVERQQKSVDLFVESIQALIQL